MIYPLLNLLTTVFINIHNRSQVRILYQLYLSQYNNLLIIPGLNPAFIIYNNLLIQYLIMEQF